MAKRVAVIGSSLLAGLLVTKYQEGVHFHVFERSNCLGGAWADMPMGTGYFPRFGNVALPKSEEQDKLLPTLLRVLTELGGDIRVFTPSFRYSGNGYSPRKAAHGHFAPAVRTAMGLPHVSVHQRQVSEVSIQEEHSLIDGEEFDSVVMFRNTFLHKLEVSGAPIALQYERNRSRHVRSAYKAEMTLSPYTEGPDEVFDRINSWANGSTTFVVGRVRRHIATHFSLEDYFMQSEVLRSLGTPAEKDIQHFQNDRLSLDSVASLLRIKKDSRFFFLDGPDLISGFQAIEALPDGI